MKKMQSRDFFAEKEYRRYIIGRFHKKDFVADMLKQYGEIYIDGPKINEYYSHGQWTIIPCPIEMINRGCFLDLMNWLSQNNEEAFAIAIHPQKSYFSRKEAENKYGDTVLVAFDDGIVVRWFLPRGLTDDAAFSQINPQNRKWSDMPVPCTCKEFLHFLGAKELIEHFKL